MKSFFRYFLVVVLIFLLQCAKRGRPSGGPKDENKPLFVVANPPYESLYFTAKKIKITFNEYIKLKNVNKQLVVSPPLKYPPSISPLGSASRHIIIRILDTLQANTTYTFDFGNSVEDNNEGNKLERFKYVFSTGSFIDSLTAKGRVKDAYENAFDKDIRLLLYKIDSSFTDSVVYKQKPKYVTSTLDTTLYHFTNLQKGKYLLIALKDHAGDYLFDPKQDKIGFFTDTIVLPKDSVINTPIALFKETLPYKFKRGKEASRGKILFGYEGKVKNMNIRLLSKVSDSFRSVSRFEMGKDSLNYWYTPVDVDSLNFVVSNANISDTVTVRLRKKKIDSLMFDSPIRSILELKDTFNITTNNPIVKLDTSKISLTDKDTIGIPYRSFISKKENKFGFIFQKEYKQKYALSILPGAVQDIYHQENDTLTYTFTTKDIEDYGAVNLQVNNPKSQDLIIELTLRSGKLVYRKFTNNSSVVAFPLLIPAEYQIRIIIDVNNNGQWDTGNYLKKIQPEKIIYYDEILKVRPYHTYNQNIMIK
ncbi:MAG: hypothetical protein GKR88_18255 [Flavobacteriaceae bacterium]|nr:MAG: hypothetical protein GKR88_18255 [Flavobacteriaceae bacterium]